MKPEEQVRAGFEAWFAKQTNSVDSKWFEKQMALDAYRAAYAQARREALEECESICSRLWLRVDGSAHDCAKAIKDLIKD